MVTPQGSRPASAEQRLKELGITLPEPPRPFGIYAEAVQTGNLLFLSGMLPTQGHEAKFVGRVGAEIDLDGARKAAELAALNALAVARQHLGSLRDSLPTSESRKAMDQFGSLLTEHPNAAPDQAKLKATYTSKN